MFSREVHHLRHFGFGDLIRKNATLPDAVMMNMQHDRGRSFNVLVEEFLQNVNHKLHRRVVVVEDQDAIEVRAFGLRLDLGNDRRSRPAPSIIAIVILAHVRTDAGDRLPERLGRDDFFRI